MSLTRLSSSALRNPQHLVRGVRHASGHGGGPHLPFTYKSKGPFVAKLTVFCAAGFGIPFLATSYSLSKSAGAS